MSGEAEAVVVNRIRRGTYLDSVVLMRMSRTLSGLDRVAAATLMMGTPANREILERAGLLTGEGRDSGPGDLVLAVRATDRAAAEAALAEAERQLAGAAPARQAGAEWQPRSLRAAVASLPEARLALISLPGAHAAAEARRALGLGLHVMLFSDNVSLAEERELKQEAATRGLLVMGPDCGTALISGLPLAFANQVPAGPIGIVGASGTGMQEVTCQIAEMGGGIRHAIGVGGRDLHAAIGGSTTLAAIDALARDPGTETLVVIAKPPDREVADRVLARLEASARPAILCLLGAPELDLPDNVRQVHTLQGAAAAALGRTETAAAPPPQLRPAARPDGSRHPDRLLGLYTGGTLCAEAQLLLLAAGLPVASNAPVAGADRHRESEPTDAHLILDLGDDAFTLGRPHPMIDPEIRGPFLGEALRRRDLAVLLADVVLGHGAHPDPAGCLAEQVERHRHPGGPQVIASVTGTEADLQQRSVQIARLRQAGVHVAPSHADAARWALAALGHG